MNRQAHTPSALIALARTRRTQRALAHAAIHRGDSLPGLRGALGFVTSTMCVADELAAAPAVGHRMSLLGISGADGDGDRVAYVMEHRGDELPIVYRLALAGARAGHLVPMHAWYSEPAAELTVAEIRRKAATLATTLVPARRGMREAWMLSTRIVQRRALRIAPGPTGHTEAIRKFALQLVVEPVSGVGPRGTTTVTAFLRPNAQLAELWTLPDGDAIARVTYTGVPNGLGVTRDTVVLLTDRVR